MSNKSEEQPTHVAYELPPALTPEKVLSRLPYQDNYDLLQLLAEIYFSSSLYVEQSPEEKDRDNTKIFQLLYFIHYLDKYQAEGDARFEATYNVKRKV